jgi:hypothetical protein
MLLVPINQQKIVGIQLYNILKLLRWVGLSNTDDNMIRAEIIVIWVTKGLMNPRKLLQCCFCGQN